MFRFKTKNGRVEISKEIVVILLMDIFTVAYMISSRELSSQSLLFPRILVILILIFSVLAIRNAVHYYRETEAPDVEEQGEGEQTGFGITKQRVLFLVLVAVMLLLFDTLGYIISFFLFLVFSMLILGVRKVPILILVPVIMLIFMYLVFDVWLAVPLPKGLLTFL